MDRVWGHSLLDSMGDDAIALLETDRQQYGYALHAYERGWRAFYSEHIGAGAGVSARRIERLAAFLIVAGRHSDRPWTLSVERVQLHLESQPGGVEVDELDGPPPDTDPVPEGIHLDVKHNDDESWTKVDARGQHLVMSLDQLVAVAGIDLNDHRVLKHQVNTWTTAMKIRKTDADGKVYEEPGIVRNWQVRAYLETRFDSSVQLPEFSVPLRRAPYVEREDSLETMIAIGDPQMGFRRLRNGKLVPLHDRRVLDLALQICAKIQPKFILWMGDTFDFAEWSERFPTPISLRDTTQPTLAEAHWWFASFRRTCPGSRIVVLEGNHGERIERSLRASPAAELTPVGEERPALSIPRLLKLDDLGVEYVGPYGASWWPWDDLEATHGDTVKSRSGATVAAEIRDRDKSLIQGHIHRNEIAYRTRWESTGPHQMFAASPGCACRLVEGLVPGFKRKNNWQQGLGEITYDTSRGQEHALVHLIDRGRLLFRGSIIDARDPTLEIQQAIGDWNFEEDWLHPYEVAA